MSLDQFAHFSDPKAKRSEDVHPWIERYPSLVGPEHARQFVVEQGDLYCLRSSCDDCPLREGCEFEEAEIPRAAVPPARRGVGVEERAFCVLRFRDDHSFETLPRELWDSPYSDKAYGHEANLHWAYVEPRRAVFHSLKGQLRYYGTEKDFSASCYCEFLRVIDYFDPVHRPASMDYSAIEPRVSTVVSREPEWLKAFQGEPRVIFREVAWRSERRPNEFPSYVVEHGDGVFYCHLVGELDKAEYADQCAKCAVREACRIREDHYKDIALDWHGTNRDAMFADRMHTLERSAEGKFTATAKETLTEWRGTSKINGLAICVSPDTLVRIRSYNPSGYAFDAPGEVCSLRMLRTLFKSNPTGWEIDSPDGFVLVTDVFESGPKQAYRVELRDGRSVTCSFAHPFETRTGFVWAKRLEGGQELLTDAGWVEVSQVVDCDEVIHMLDVEVGHANHRFYACGVSTHNTYGGTAYTIASNMGSTTDEAGVLIGNFLRKLVVLQQYMVRARAEVATTGVVVNLMGRQWDIKHLVHSRKVDALGSPDFSARKKDLLYAERLSLNFPIQSTAAEFLKIGHIRADEKIIVNGWSPTYSWDIPTVMCPLPSYRDLKAVMISSVHDEVVYLLRDDVFDEVVPVLYEAMQLDDVLDAMQVGFTLELDCEFDTTRSWTASRSYDASRTYLRRHLKTVSGPDLQAEGRPNFALVDFSDVTEDLLRHLSELIARRGVEGSNSAGEKYPLGVLSGKDLYQHGVQFTVGELEVLGVPYRLVHYRPERNRPVPPPIYS